MAKRNELAFENWWACLPDYERASLNEKVCRKSFFAGYCAGNQPNDKRFVFKAGKRRVTVTAPTMGAAKKKAEAVLNSRMRSEGHFTRQSWTLQTVIDGNAVQ